MKNAEIDCLYTDNIVCPYCGEEVSDCWEMSSDSDEYECGECGAWFFYERNVSVSYSTTKLDPVEAEKLIRFGCRGCAVRMDGKCGHYVASSKKYDDEWLKLVSSMPKIAEMTSCPKKSEV